MLRTAKHLTAVLAATVALAQPSPAADMYPRATLEQRYLDLRGAVEATVKIDLLNALPFDQYQEVSGLRVEIPLRDKSPTAPPHTAYARTFDQTIILPIETLHFWGDMGLVFAWFVHRGCISAPISSYFYQIARTPYATPPLTAFNLDKERLIAIPFVDRLSYRITNTAFNFILAHEMGHLYFRHIATRDPSLSQANEIAADRFALDLLERRNMPPIGMAYFFMAARYMEGFSWDAATMTHPPSADRVDAIADRLRAAPDGFLKPGLSAADQAADRARLLSMADDMSGIAQSMRDDKAHRVLTRNLPRVFPASSFATACPM